MLVNHPFSTTPYSIGSLGNGQPWIDDPIPLSTMLAFFYDVHRFKIYVTGIDASSNDPTTTIPLDGDSALSALGQADAQLGQGNSASAIGLSSRQMQVPPQILIDIAAAQKKVNTPGATQTDQSSLTALLSKAEMTAAPGESKDFLRAIDVNTKSAYPIHTFSSNGISVRIDFGSVKMVGQGMSFPADRTIVPSYNRYTSPSFAPAVYAVVGNVGQMVNAYLIGDISLNLTNGGGYLVSLYGTNPSDSFASGTIYAREFYSNLNLSPSSGQTGTTVKIKVGIDPAVTDPSLMKCFSGFKDVKRVSFNGFDVTSSFSFQSQNLGLDSTTHAQVVNESCSVTVPSGAQSGCFTFYSESKDSSGTVTCNQFTVPQKFFVTS